MPDYTDAHIAVPDELADSGPTIAGIAQNISDELNRLRSLLGPLLDYWQGNANLGWQDLQNTWDAAASDLMGAPGALGAIGHTATRNWLNYIDCEAANTRTWAH